MRYSYSISHTPGKALLTADTLSLAPVSPNTNLKDTDKDLMEDTNIYVDEIMNGLPASSTYMAQLKEQLKEGSVCSDVISFCQRGWPDHNQLTGPVKVYWPERAVLTVHDDLLLKGSRLVIHTAMRNSVLDALHEGHQGMTRCRERARETVRWPGLSSQLNELVRNCKTCIKERANPVEPLLSSFRRGRGKKWLQIYSPSTTAPTC